MSIENEIKPKFKAGDKVTYKDRDELPDRKYRYGGENQKGHVGTVREIKSFNKASGCYRISVNSRRGGYFAMLESEFEEYDNLKQIKTKPKMKIIKTVETEINSKQRELTIVVTTIGNIVRAGYSIRMPQDKPNQELAEKIALGRATNDRTNLVDMVVGRGMKEEYILYAIADNLIKKFERGLIEIKGVK